MSAVNSDPEVPDQAGRGSSEEGDAPLPPAGQVLEELARLRHDLNNRLTAAMGEVELLLLDPQPDDVGAALRRILAELEAMGARLEAIDRALSRPG